MLFDFILWYSLFLMIFQRVFGIAFTDNLSILFQSKISWARQMAVIGIRSIMFNRTTGRHTSTLRSCTGYELCEISWYNLQRNWRWVTSTTSILASSTQIQWMVKFQALHWIYLCLGLLSSYRRCIKFCE